MVQFVKRRQLKQPGNRFLGDESIKVLDFPAHLDCEADIQGMPRVKDFTALTSLISGFARSQYVAEAKRITKVKEAHLPDLRLFIFCFATMSRICQLVLPSRKSRP